MKFDLGLTVVVISMVIFYLRLIQIRGRRRREVREEQLARMRAGTKRKPGEAPARSPAERPTFQVASWVLVIGGAVVMLAGLAMRTSDLFPAAIATYWWAVTAAGVLLFTFSFK